MISPGSILNIQPFHPIYHPLKDEIVRKIRMRITDQNDRPIDLNGQHVDYLLNILKWLLRNLDSYYYKQKGSGIDYTISMTGNGMFTDTMKMLGKELWVVEKTLFKNQILPNLKIAAKHGLQSGKQLIEDNKKEIGKVISDQSKNLLKNLIDWSKGDRDNIWYKW